MVRVGDYELRLVRPSGEAYPEVTGADGKVYTVAEPGSAYEVRLQRFPSRYDSAKPDGTFHSAALYVDGQSVGYNKFWKQPATGNFVGFLKAGDADGVAYQSFVFAKPVETEAKQATGANFTEGSIKCLVSLARYTGGLLQQQRFLGPASTNESVAKLPEGKKFFMAPSLTTGKGELKMGSGFDSRAWQYVGQQGDVAVLQLRYETAATLLLRGVLKQDNAAHRAILQQFPDTAEQNENAAGPSRQPAAAAAAAAAGSGRARKRQRQQAAAEEEEELIDLTKGFNAKDEVLAAKRANKTLECDLTGDDEGPTWRAVKQEAHTVS